MPGAFYRCSEVVWQDPTANEAPRHPSAVSAADRVTKARLDGVGILEWVHARHHRDLEAEAAAAHSGRGFDVPPSRDGKRSSGRLPAVGVPFGGSKGTPRALAVCYPSSLKPFFTEQLLSPTNPGPSAPLIPLEPSVEVLCEAMHVAALVSESAYASPADAARASSGKSDESDEDEQPTFLQIKAWEASRQQVIISFTMCIAWMLHCNAIICDDDD